MSVATFLILPNPVLEWAGMAEGHSLREGTDSWSRGFTKFLS